MTEHEIRLIEQRHIEAVLGLNEPKKNGRESAEQIDGEALEQARIMPPALPGEPRTIHYTELPEDTSDSPIAGEWNCYRREVGRLLAEGHENRWVLIKNETVVGIWDSREEAKTAALERYLMQDVLIHQVLAREPVLRTPTRWRRCQT